MILRHGWVLDATATRDVLGPRSMMMSETLFRALLLTGLPPLDVVGTASAMLWFVNGAAGVVVGEQAATRRTGQTVEEYYETRAGFWTTVFEQERYPAHVHLWERGAFDDASGLDFGHALAAFLDGLELRVANYAEPPPPGSAR